MYDVYGLFFILICSGLCVLTEDPIRSVLWLFVTFFVSSSLLLISGIEYAAYVLVMVYLVAIIVLFLFIVMMLDIKGDFSSVKIFDTKLQRIFFSGMLFIFVNYFLFIFFIYFIRSSGFNVKWIEESLASMNWIDISLMDLDIKTIGNHLYDFFIVPLIISAFILFVAMLGSVFLTMEFKDDYLYKKKKQRLARQTMKESYLYKRRSRFK